jgi:crotonobetainyl-CoA:carnitine CoA-transferase CaiB-like acyl-CoA transferase
VLDLPTDADAAAVAAKVRSRPAEEWRAAFAGRNACVSVVASLEEALRDPQLDARGLFDWKLRVGGETMPALPVPIDRAFRGEPGGD